MDGQDFNTNAVNNADPERPMMYQIRLKGELGPDWVDWFGGLTITLMNNGETCLSGAVADQAALHGLLRKVRDLGLPLLSITSSASDDTPLNDTPKGHIQK